MSFVCSGSAPLVSIVMLAVRGKQNLHPLLHSRPSARVLALDNLDQPSSPWAKLITSLWRLPHRDVSAAADVLDDFPGRKNHRSGGSR